MPTRTGYSFVGWRGRNLINLFEMQKDKNFWVNFTSNSVSENIKNLDSNAITIGEVNPQSFSNVILGYITDILEVGKEYLLTCDFSSTRNDNEPQFSVDGVDETTDERVQASLTKFVVLANTRYYFKFYINASANNLIGSCEVTYYNLMLTKLSNTNERVYYEPYYIQRDTVFSNPYDRTLVAEWIEDSKNLFTNGDFETVTTLTNRGWDDNLNGTLQATDWEDYNKDVDNPEVGYHAHIKDITSTDPLHGHVFEFNCVNDRWLGACQVISIPNGTFMFVAQLFRVTGVNIMRPAAYYKSSTGYINTGYMNGGGVFFQEEMVQGEWVTVRGYITIEDNIDSSFRFYFYGQEGDVGIFYLDNVFLTQIA